MWDSITLYFIEYVNFVWMYNEAFRYELYKFFDAVGPEHVASCTPFISLNNKNQLNGYIMFGLSTYNNLVSLV